MTKGKGNRRANATALMVGAVALTLLVPSAGAEIDGHGPDAWRVQGISADDGLDARMGPGTDYPVIESFAHDERGMQQITCVPFYTAAHYTVMTEAEIEALPPRWCLMRNKSMSKAGWVEQRFITPDESAAGEQVSPGDDAMIADAQTIVRELYDAQALADRGQGPDPLQRDAASRYFTSDIVALFETGEIAAHPLYGAQDFEGSITRIAPDEDMPMLRGMISINVDFTNFGEKQRAVYQLRADPTQAGSPLRIFRVEHEGWSYP